MGEAHGATWEVAGVWKSPRMKVVVLLKIAILSEKLAAFIAFKSLDIKVHRVYMPLQAVLIIVLLIASRVRAAIYCCVIILTLSKSLK